MGYLLKGSIYHLAKLSKSELVNQMKSTLSSEEINPSEVRSWENSLYSLIQLLNENDLDNLYLIAEYSLIADQRIDAILFGYSKQHKPLAVIVELKQWSSLKDRIDDEGDTLLVSYGDSSVERLHPIQQTINYERQLKYYHSKVKSNHIDIDSIQYLHNFPKKNKNKFFEGEHKAYKVRSDKMFVKEEDSRLVSYLNKTFNKDLSGDKVSKDFLDGYYVLGEQGFKVLRRILDNKTSPPMEKDQTKCAKKIFSKFQDFATNPRDICIVVSGSAGTGKTYLGMHIIRTALKLSSTFNKDNIIFTFSRNRTLKAILDKEAGIESFKWPYIQAINPNSPYKLIVVDEAHRIENINNDIGRLYECEQPRIVVLLQDDLQRIKVTEQGSYKNIVSYLVSRKIEHYTYKVSSQKRSNHEYVSKVKKFLYDNEYVSESNSRDINSSEFDINTSYSLLEIDNILKDKAKGFNSRWYASFDWAWVNKDLNNKITSEAISNIKYEIEISENGEFFRKYWNPKHNQYDWYKGKPRIIKSTNGPESLEILAIDQVGCVHTAQGLDYDYIGLIWYKDLYWDEVNNRWSFEFDEVYDPKEDRWVFKLRYLKDGLFIGSAEKHLNDNQGSIESIEEVLGLLLNQYYILLTRARKGIYIWFEDEATKRKFESVVLNEQAICQE